MHKYHIQIILIVLFSLVSLSYSWAQIADLDQAEKLEAQMPNQDYENKMLTYQQLIRFYHKNSLDKSFLLSEQMLAEAKNAKDILNQAEALNYIGSSYIRKGDFEKAKGIHLEAYLLYQKINHISGLASQLGNLGVISEFTGKLPEAIGFYQEALRMYKKNHDFKNISFIHNNIGIVYQTMGLFEPALKHQKQAFKIKKELNDTSGMASTLNNIGVLFESLKEDFESALFYYYQSLSLFESVYNELQIGTLNNNIGLIYLKQEKLDKAEIYLNKAFLIRGSIGDLFGQACTQLNIAQLKMKQNKIDKALKLSHQCLDVFLMSNSILKIAETYQILSQLYEIKNDYKNALQNQIKYALFKDSLLNESNQKIIHEMQARFDSETNLQKLQLLEKDNILINKQIIYDRRIIFGIIITILLVGLIVFFYVRQHQLRLKHRHLVVEQKFFRAQMNPHFIFNALSSIQSFVLENDTETGSKYITRFARMMRKILDYSSKEFISLSDEIDLLKEYVAFQQLRFNHSFELVVDFDENIEKDLIGVPPMIIQPFVENAIEHGIREIDNGLISIRIMERNGQISVEILDNGIGYNQSQHQLYSQNHYSKAISITNERLRLFSKNNKHILPVKILDLSDFSSLSGTKVIIELPTKNI